MRSSTKRLVGALSLTALVGLSLAFGSNPVHAIEASGSTSRALRVVSGRTLGFPSALPGVQAYELPSGDYVWHAGAFTDGRYVTFGLEPPGGGDGGPCVKCFTKPLGRIGVIDRHNGRLTVLPSVARHAYTDRVEPVVVNRVHYLVWVEQTVRPISSCQDLHDGCWAWHLYAKQLPNGHPRLIAGSKTWASVSRYQGPEVRGSSVYWQASASTTIPASGPYVLYLWTPGQPIRVITRTPTVVAEIAYEKPSLWLAYHRVFGAPMMLVRMTPTGRVLSSTTFVVPSGEPTDAVFDIHGTHFVRLRYNLTGSEIDVGSLARPLAWKPVWKTTKIVYGIKWISNDQLIVWDGTNRPLLISTTKAPLATLPLDRLTQSNLTGSTVVTIVNRDGRSYVALTNKQH